MFKNVMAEPQRLKSLIAVLLMKYLKGRNKKRSSCFLLGMAVIGIFCSFNILELKSKKKISQFEVTNAKQRIPLHFLFGMLTLIFPNVILYKTSVRFVFFFLVILRMRR